MIANIGAASGLRSLAVRRRLCAAFVGGLLAWIAIVAARGALLVAQSFSLADIGEPERSSASAPLLTAAGLIVLFCVAAAMTTRRFRPAATLPVTCGAGGLVLLAAAITSGSIGPLLLVLAIFAVACLLGLGLLSRLPSPPSHPILSLPIAVALGLGSGGLLLFLLATFGRLNAVAVSGLAVAILALVLLLDRRRLAADPARLRAWRPETPSWFETIVIGLAVGALTFAILSDFVPENDSDASRDHLPIAREIWQSGTVDASRDPGQGHLLYAVAYGLAGQGYAGITATKLVHAGVGLAGIVGIAGLGWLVSGRLAAVVAAALFATMPLVLWGVGHPPLDLFPVLFTVAAMLCIFHWQRVGSPAWLVVTGALAGFGFAAKITMAWMVVALAAAIFLVGRKPGRVWERVFAVLAFGAGTVVLVPWLVRGYSITGTVPGLGMVVDLLTASLSRLGIPGVREIGTSAGMSAPVASVPISVGASPASDVPLANSLLEFARMPWLLTFDINQLKYTTLSISPIGVAPLLLLPLALLGPRTRATAALAVTAVLSYVAWWVTPLQVVRHLLPTLAVVAVLVGVGTASAVTGVAAGPRRPLALAAGTGLFVGLFAALLLFLPEKQIGISLDRLTGRETAAEYVAREIPSTAIFAATNDTLPPGTIVGYVADQEPSPIYTDVQLIRLDALRSPKTTSAEELAFLDRLNINYFIWNRALTMPEAWRSTFLSTEFLREHSRILAGDDNAYLFEILPGGGLTWGEKEPHNLLADPGLRKVKNAGGPWTTVGRVKEQAGRVSMREESSIAQQFPVSAGSPYLLSAFAACEDPGADAELRLRWVDGAGETISTAAESVIPGSEGSEQFLWRRAPDHATSVSVELASRGCEFDVAALYALS